MIKEKYKNDLFTKGAKALREYAVTLEKTDIVFDAWRMLNKAFPKNVVKMTDINSIKDILKNIDEIKKLG